jgi:hypothetical protein
VFFDWNEILDMEVRIEDNLTLSDAGIVAAGIWSACNSCLMLTEDKIRKLFEKLDEQSKTDEENKT